MAKHPDTKLSDAKQQLYDLRQEVCEGLVELEPDALRLLKHISEKSADRYSKLAHTLANTNLENSIASVAEEEASNAALFHHFKRS